MRIPDSDEWILEFEPERTRLENRVAKLEDENKRLCAENETLGRRRIDTETIVRSQPKRHRRLSLGGVIELLLPEVKLLRDSLDVLEQEIESPYVVLEELRQLCYFNRAVV